MAIPIIVGNDYTIGNMKFDSEANDEQFQISTENQNTKSFVIPRNMEDYITIIVGNK